jgi:hypothetical protein
MDHSKLRRLCAPSPSPPFVYAQRDRGPQPSVGWRPRSGREIKRAETWSHAVGRPLGSIQQVSLTNLVQKFLYIFLSVAKIVGTFGQMDYMIC